MLSLPEIYLALLGLAIFIYAILDGYDLGVGILLSSKPVEQRDHMIASIGPFWDANETWLVLAVGILLVAFPLAQGEIFQALYLPCTVMIVSLIFRGVAFDFRAKMSSHRKDKWDAVFQWSSLVASFSQGYMLGIYALGLQTDLAAQCFAILSGFGVTAAYRLIGACWLIMKTEGALQASAARHASSSLWLMGIGLAAVSIANVFVHAQGKAIWFESSYRYALWLIPVVCFVLLAMLQIVLLKLPKANYSGAFAPYLITVAVFFIAFLGLGFTYWPDIIPGQLSVADAAASEASLQFLLVGTVIVVPCILLYTAFSYYVFRGKTKALNYY